MLDEHAVLMFCLVAVSLIGFQSLISALVNGKANPNGLHLARRVQHAMSGLVLLPITYTSLLEDYWVACLLLLLFGASVVFALHVARLYDNRVQELLVKGYGSLAREDEIVNKKVPGAFYFMLGLALALLSTDEFPQGLKPLRLSLLYLSLGDPLAGIVGRLFDHSAIRVYGKKTLAGSLACMLTCFVCTLTQTSNVFFA